MIYLAQDAVSPKKLEQAHLELISRSLASIKSTASQAADTAEQLNQLSQKIPVIQLVMNDITELPKIVQFQDEF